MEDQNQSTQQAYNEYREDEISLKELLSAILNQRKMISIIVLIALTITAAGSLIMADRSKEGQLIVSLKFEGASEGKYPDGSKFETYSIVSPFVISNTIKNLKIENQVTANEIRANIKIVPIIPKEIEEKKLFALEKEGESFEYFPTDYLVKLKTTGNMDEKAVAKILNQIVEEYSFYIHNEYGQLQPVVNQLLIFDEKTNDYSDTSQVFHQQMNQLIAYNQKLSETDSSFRSSKSGMSFYEITEAAKIIDTIDLNRLDSLISAYKLTKFEDRLVGYYTYLIEKLTLEKNKLAGQTEASKNMLSSIDNSQNDILSSMTGELLESQSKESYFNALLLQTAQVGTGSAQLSEDIAFYETELAELKNGTYKTILGRDGVLIEADNLVNTIKGQIIKITELSDQTAQEFYTKSVGTTVTALSPAEVNSNVKLSLNLAIGLVLGLMAGVFVALFKDYWNRA